MTILFNRFPQVRLLLVSLWVVGYTLGVAPLGYAQDIPTPTPPADGGEFEGAPDPTPGPEATPEPSSSPVEPTTPVDGPAPTSDVENPTTEGSSGGVGQEQAPVAPSTDAGVDSSVADAPASPTSGSAPANNSPRGLW
ncbi:hypothetical protein [Leptothoe sp. PORK10 BA2]|uniref:hypothetical protein n=1 Tax=Leptothoe sp. PORK10 BA2 TaxID=3110254 RepID=UPI002B201187|nr:hypothetical protein [Leptothoe sp. PORK10 BA2]MEA5466778.1 hypothetical protein [Leptothoe sp. PORK10 BA2]